MTKICVTGTESTPKELKERLAAIFAADAQALCEIRMDFLGLSPSDSLAFLRGLPVEWAKRSIITQRLALTGEAGRGQCRWTLPVWQAWWKEAIQIHDWFAVDIDWVLLDRIEAESVKWDLASLQTRNLIFSHHGELPEFLSIYQQFFEFTGKYAAGVKVALAIDSPADLKKFFQLAKRFASIDPHVCIPMGGVGRMVRFSKLTGSWTYVAADSDSVTAPGQVQWSLARHFSNKLPDKKFVLLANDSRNLVGETAWNNFFQRHNINALYLNLSFANEMSESKSAREKYELELLESLRLSEIRGVSVTQPHKDNFPVLSKKALGRKGPINSILLGKTRVSDRAANTDGIAVARIIQRRFLKRKPAHVLILGGGGAGRGVEHALRKLRIKTKIWQRNDRGILPRLQEKNFDVLVSTWPITETKTLVAKLKKSQTSFKNLQLVIDAALEFDQKKSALKRWAWDSKLNYYSGSDWWSEQAFAQMEFFGLDKFESISRASALQLVPSSKSHMIRLLLIAARIPNVVSISHNGYSEDVEQMISALKSLGADIIFGEREIIVGDKSLDLSTQRVIKIIGSATAFRFISSLLHWSQTTAVELDADDGLRGRIQKDSWAKQIFINTGWPRRIRTGNIDLTLTSEQTSQYHSGYAIAAATDGKTKDLKFDSNFPSQPYFKLTIHALREFGLIRQLRKGILVFEQGEIGASVGSTSNTHGPNSLRIDAFPDISCIAYLELAARFLRLSSFRNDVRKNSSKAISVQADGIVFAFMEKLINEESIEVDAKDFPDLVPTMFAATILFQRSLTLRGVKNLKFKESNRVKSLSEIAKRIGASFTESRDCVQIDARACRGPNPDRKFDILLKTYNDHRIAMTIGLLSLRWPVLVPDDKGCVDKSFPGFWNALELIKGARP